MASTEIVHAHAAPQGFIRKYIFSLDHKIIGLQYYFLALIAVFVGMGLSLLMRIHLIWPTASLPIFGEIKPETYLTLLTMHGTIMVFFVLTTAPQSGFGNYFLPIQIGAPDMAFPTLNMLSFWTTFIAFAVMIAAFFVEGGAPLHGWTGYAPLSAIQGAGPGEGLGADLWIASIAIFCAASLMGALNFITTVLDMRAKGMTLMRMPLTCWAWFITAILGLLAFGVLLAAGILLLMDRNLGTSFFVPGGLVVSGNAVSTVAAHLCSGNICSGSLVTPRCISRSFPVWAWRHSYFPRSRVSPSSDTERWCTRCWPSGSWDLWSGATTCS